MTYVIDDSFGISVGAVPEVPILPILIIGGIVAVGLILAVKKDAD